MSAPWSAIGAKEDHGGGPIDFCVFAAGAAIVPLVSTALVPTRRGAVLLAAWAGGSAAWVASAIAGDSDGTILLLVAMMAAGALAVLLATSDRLRAPTAGPPRPPAR